MSENVTINSQQATAPKSPTVGGNMKWSDVYGTPAVTQTVVSSQVTNPSGSQSGQINIPLGN